METADQPANSKPFRRWFYPTPGRLLVVLLVVECILLLSEQWLPKGWAVLTCITSVTAVILFLLLWFFFALLFHWRFQFSIRSLLILTIAVAIPCSWLTVEMKWARDQKDAVDALIKLGGAFQYDYERDSLGYPIPGATTPGPAWLRKSLGDDFFRNVPLVTLYNLKNVFNADLEHLKKLSQLKTLYLCETNITDAGLEHIKVLKQLKYLLLKGTQITDVGLEHLGGMKQLFQLDLTDTQVTDAGLDHLKGLKQLRILDLWKTQVTDTGVENFQKELPKVTIGH